MIAADAFFSRITRNFWNVYIEYEFDSIQNEVENLIPNFVMSVKTKQNKNHKKINIAIETQVLKSSQKWDVLIVRFINKKKKGHWIFY